MNFIWRIFEVRSRQFVLSRESQAKTNFISYLNYDGCWISRNVWCLLWSFLVHDTKRKTLFFLFIGHALKNLWACDLWRIGRKSKYVIEVLEEFAWWATKVFSFHRLRKWWCIVFPLHYSFQFFITKDRFKWYFCHP